jgi:signal transduction histidine kinase
MPTHIPKLLIVDDDIFFRKMLPMKLKSKGFIIETVDDGLAALEKFSADRDINMIICDLEMPGMSGLNLIQSLRNIDNDVSIIVLTANDDISVAIQAIHSGANDYILKDEHILKTLLISVESVWEKHQLKINNLQLMRDLSQKNNALQESNQELVRLNQLKSRFLGLAAHDFRNPLTSIRGLSELLLGEAFGHLNEEQSEYIKIIHQASDDMLTLVNNLLDVSLIESGKLELHLKKSSLADLILNRIKMNRVLAEKKRITIQSKIEKIPEFFFDQKCITQVFDNILSNAIKFSPHGTRVFIAVHLENNAATVKVTDEGPGIPEEDKKRLFVEFQRLSAKPTGGEKSTGLGLAIVKKIVEAHGGVLKVESTAGSGSTFSFTIPANF